MNRTNVLRRNVLLAGTFATAMFAGAPAWAAGITLNDPNCDSFTLTGTAPNQVLTCVVSSAPTCTITGGNVTAQTGASVTLTASCSGSPSNWAWTGGSCAGKTTQSCAASEGATGAVNYSVTATNTVGSSNTPSTTVTWSNTPVAPANCSLSASPSSLAAAGSVVLTASCSGGGVPTSYAWTGAGATATTTVASQTVSVASTTSFSVTPSNAGGNGNAAGTTVTVNSPPQTGKLSCPGYASTKVIDAVVPVAQGGEVRYYTNKSVFGTGGTTTASGFGPDDAVIVRFTMPAGETSVALSMTYTSLASLRTAVLSTDPCDFTVPSPTGLYARNYKLSSFTANLTTDMSNTSSTVSKLGPGTYYLNVSNRVDGVNKCTSTTGYCDAFFTFYNTP